jgi:CheY-like chemotaxis protein
VLIVDDHADFRRSSTALLEAEGFHVVGEAADGAEAISAVARLRPDIVLLDIQLPRRDGFLVAEQLSTGPDPPVAVLVGASLKLVEDDHRAIGRPARVRRPTGVGERHRYQITRRRRPEEDQRC